MVQRIFIMLVLTLPGGSYAQEIDTLSVSHNKTTYIIFSTDVNLVDLGTKEFAYSARENIVMLKAVKEFAGATSLMVRTKTDVKVWIIKYQKDPASILVDTRLTDVSSAEKKSIATPDVLPLVTTKMEEPKSKAHVHQSGYVSQEQYQRSAAEKYKDITQPANIKQRQNNGNRDVDIKDYSMEQKIYFVLTQKKSFRDIGEISNGIYFMLYDVFVDRENIYVKIGVNNTSSIAFDLDFLSFERAQGRSMKKREGLSQSMLEAVHKESVLTVSPSTEEVMVYVLKLFAFQDNDNIVVKLNELGGIRTMKFLIPAKLVMNAKTL